MKAELMKILFIRKAIKSIRGNLTEILAILLELEKDVVCVPNDELYRSG